MKKEYILHEGNSRLILIFLGWGMDPSHFRTLRKNGYDILAVYDYTGYHDGCGDEARFADIVAGYAETVVFGWSFGVRVASSFLRNHGKSLPLTRTVAINGTATHIHDRLGIPPAIFNGTLAGLSETTLRKFHRRMFADNAGYSHFMSNPPARALSNLIEELRTFGALPAIDATDVWDIAVISEADHIFPYKNQVAAWSRNNVVTLKGAPHFPDIQALLDRLVVDKGLVATKFSHATKTYADNAYVQTMVAQELWKQTSRFINHMTASPREVLEIGFGNGTLTQAYADKLQGCHLRLWDIAPMPMPPYAPSDASMECCDAEIAISSIKAGSVDLLLSSSTMQWFHSVPKFIGKLPLVLSLHGIAALALYGKGTYGEIESVTGRSLSYPSLEILSDAARESGLRILYSAEKRKSICFKSVNTLLKHLKLTGVNALGGDDGAQASALRLMRSYPTLPDGSAPLTYHPLYLILQKDHE